MAKMSIVGLWSHDNSIWDGFNVPEGMNKDTAVNFIMSSTQEMSVIYTEPESMKFMISNWSGRMLPIWTKLYRTTVLDYNPIENYNRSEEWEEKRVGKVDEDITKDIERTDNRTLNKSYGKNTVNNTQHSGNDVLKDEGTNTVAPGQTTTNSAKAFNDGNFVEREKTALSGQNTETANMSHTTTYNSNVKISNSGADTETGTDNLKTIGTDIISTVRNDNDNMTKKGIAKGNIGVTTTQQMIEQERLVAVYDIYTAIVDSFKENFCVMIW